MPMILPLLLALQFPDRLSPANPLPAPESEEAQVLAPVQRLFGTLAIDGDVAMVCSAHTLTADGRLAHRGTDLVRENGAWKMLNITWTKRTSRGDAR